MDGNILFINDIWNLVLKFLFGFECKNPHASFKHGGFKEDYGSGMGGVESPLRERRALTEGAAPRKRL